MNTKASSPEAGHSNPYAESDSVTQNATPHRAPEGHLGLLIARFVLGLIALLVGVAVLGRAFREDLEALGREFVASFGASGMAVGTFVADGFHFPIPPQFYMLMAIATDLSDVWAMLAISAGSVLGGFGGFFAAGRLGRIGWIEKRVASPEVTRLLRGKLGMKGLILLSVTPVAFSWLTYFCGLSRYPWRYAALLCALRLPKLAIYYWLVRFGWAL